MGTNATSFDRRKRLRRTSLIITSVALAAAGAVPASAVAADSTEAATIFAASLRGANEVPVEGGPAAGDENGSALEFIKVQGDTVSVAVTWHGTGKPTQLHLHQGAKGANGDVKIDFTKLLKKGKATKGHTFTGTVKVADAALLEQLKNDPGSFYANLHTAEFPGGAVRGQLHAVTVAAFDFKDALKNFRAPVIKGEQIYECKAATGGGYAFAQRDVSAVLAGGIAHSYVAPNSGIPQWVARDGSAVTGSVLTRTSNGDGNIAELDLKATQSGADQGLFVGVTEILRLNTVGGTAPTGSCTEGEIVGVPYQADYVFLRG